MSDPVETFPPVHLPFLNHLGARIADLPDRGEVHLALKPEFCNSRGVAHGGVVMTLLDTCMARAARARRRKDGEEDLGASTIEMKATFMKPGSGPMLIARGVCVQRTASLAFCEGEVRDMSDNLVAKSSGTFKFISPRAHAARLSAQAD